MTTYDITNISDTYRIEYRCAGTYTIHIVEFLLLDNNLLREIDGALKTKITVGIRFKYYPVVAGQISRFDHDSSSGVCSIEVQGVVL
jgi:hypothetical protein